MKQTFFFRIIIQSMHIYNSFRSRDLWKNPRPIISIHRNSQLKIDEITEFIELQFFNIQRFSLPTVIPRNRISHRTCDGIQQPASQPAGLISSKRFRRRFGADSCFVAREITFVCMHHLHRTLRSPRNHGDKFVSRGRPRAIGHRQ